MMGRRGGSVHGKADEAWSGRCTGAKRHELCKCMGVNIDEIHTHTDTPVPSAQRHSIKGVSEFVCRDSGLLVVACDHGRRHHGRFGCSGCHLDCTIDLGFDEDGFARHVLDAMLPGRRPGKRPWLPSRDSCSRALYYGTAFLVPYLWVTSSDEGPSRIREKNT